MPFGECTITLQDVAYQLGLPIDGFHERFRVLPADASEETVRIYAHAYILMLLSSYLFADKNANRVHLRWLPYLASMEDLGRYSWGRLHWPGCIDVFIVGQTKTLLTWPVHYSFYSLGFSGGFPV
ncbi:hypothetical protein Ahy_B03g067184 isoform B [Arachis hypogaea]|uniref:Aminotransferase-like plant mobile domain-containing protein n=1 Tax=Arachis hypogaea TaxID=3818 RepID=A0A445A602_ARAHY|nr:hypothetical protein Ahy_B03g067184 isoform B [Arachis hypogaea]